MGFPGLSKTRERVEGEGRRGREPAVSEQDTWVTPTFTDVKTEAHRELPGSYSSWLHTVKKRKEVVT